MYRSILEGEFFMNHPEPLTFGVVGLGGYASTVPDLLFRTAGLTPPTARMAALYSNDLDHHPQRVEQLRQRGVTICTSLDNLLSEPIDAVFLPVPIDLHRSMTVKALEAGKHVLCEKPAAGSVDDVDAMIAARDRSGRVAAVGFSSVFDHTAMPLKRRLLSGEFGRIRSASIYACWPRDSAYYGRSAWAGCISRNGVWVMDGPAHNALSHQINYALFMMGAQPQTAAVLRTVEAERYRVNPIENDDTCAMRVTMNDGVTLLVFLTHACAQTIGPEVVIECERGVIRHDFESNTIETSRGVETIARPPESRTDMMHRFWCEVRGLPDEDRAFCSLEIARAQVIVVNGAAEASPSHRLPDTAYRVQPAERTGHTLHVIDGIESLLADCVQRRQLPHETGLADWTRPAGQCDLTNYRRFAGPKASATQRHDIRPPTSSRG